MILKTEFSEDNNSLETVVFKDKILIHIVLFPDDEKNRTITNLELTPIELKRISTVIKKTVKYWEKKNIKKLYK